MRTDGSRRDEILDAVVDYILTHGVSDLSLRPVAAAAGTRARLLIYHFGSREAMLIEAMERIQQRAQQDFLSRIASRRPGTPGALARVFWAWATDEMNQGVARLFFEIHGRALQNPGQYARYAHESAGRWRKMVGQVLPKHWPARRREDIATITMGGLDGLLLDYLSTGDTARTTRALELFATEIDRLVERRNR